MTTKLHQLENFYSVYIFIKYLNTFTPKYSGKAKDKISGAQKQRSSEIAHLIPPTERSGKIYPRGIFTTGQKFIPLIL